MTSYSFVLDANGKQLAPTKEPKAWFLIRKKRAALVSKYPMVIQLKKKIQENEICKDEIRCGIDDGGLHVGIALVPVSYQPLAVTTPESARRME